MPTSSAYFFLEMAVVVFVCGFGLQDWTRRQFRSRVMWTAIVGLAAFWFTIDQVAVRIGLWTFSGRGTLPVRLFSLPIEEYIVFFLHTFVCAVLLQLCSGTQK